MNDLLNLAMKAHGGLERWKQVRNMQAKVTLNGTLWQIKGRPHGLSGVVMRLNTKQPDLTITPFPKPGTAGHFTPSRVWIEDANGTVVSELRNPRDSFAGAVLTTKWNELQELYFASYAFWNYFTAPFLLAQPGIEVEEIETHDEDEHLALQATTARELYDRMLKLYPDWINRGALWTSMRAVKT